MENNFYEKGLKFECRRCSYCCGNGPGFVYLSKADLERFCAHFEMQPIAFVEKYCRWVTYYEGKTVLALIETKKLECVLWNNGCTAYKGRPVQCRTWPFWDWMVKEKADWDECAKDCPGMNSGPVHSKEEIEKAAKEYKENIPLDFEQWQADYL